MEYEDVSTSDLQRMMAEKAHELFRVCDSEEKGFICKRDMQKLQGELPLSPEQLDHVFDSLDDDGNGFLTLEEFTDGFGSFLGLKNIAGVDDDGVDQAVYEMDNDDGYRDTQEGDMAFQQMMQNVGAHCLFDDEQTIKTIWGRLRRNEPEVASNFEDLLYKVTTDLKRSKTDFESLEGALRSKTSAHDEEVRKLYEEMELQIKAEKERILGEEKAKERTLRETMESELREKDRQLQELLAKHAEMEDKLGHLNMTEAETKVENEKLAKEKDALEETLMKSQSNLEESQSYIHQLRQQQKDEKRQRARAALQLTEGIALERETLVKQLDMLKTMNKKLLDDKDEAEIRRDLSFANSQNASIEQEMEAASPRKTPQKGDFQRQGSVLGKYFQPKGVSKLPGDAQSIEEDVEEEEERGGDEEEDDGIECDDDAYIGQTPSFIHFSNNDTNINSMPDPAHHSTPKHYNDNTDGCHGNIGESSLHDDKQQNQATVNSQMANMGQVAYTVSAANNFARLESSGGPSFDPATPRSQPVGADQQMNDSGIQLPAEPSPLQRIFKVVFVGDSGVGKSSFIHRFCHNTFKPSYAATIGVDFQIKPMIVDGQSICLQVWDTAGQERFRSITKQYFRKADGVIIMYDVTSETSFTNIRNWMISVKEGVNDETITVVLGNKSDLPEEDQMKAVKTKDGSRLADDYGSLFYETSALSGDNVTNAMEALARILKEKEDLEIEKSLRLEDTTVKKKGCCS